MTTADSEGVRTRRVPLGTSFATLVCLPSVLIRCTAGPDRSRTWTLEAREARIGTAPDLEIALTDPTVSRLHARFTPTGRGWVVEDQASTNGLLVDGVRVTGAYLRAGTRVQLGDSHFECIPGQREILASPSSSPEFHGIVGTGARMKELFGVAQQVGQLDVSVVITGPTGTGKGALAKAIHAASPRSAGPFAVLDCANLSGDLVRAELFGHEKGAFTGADQARPGVFEAARGGTVFLDEVGEMSLEVQPRLLRALEDRSICRMGSHRPVDIDVRVVAATHRNLRQMVVDGRFREDLYYRIAVVELETPALTERPEDLGPLSCRFLEALGQRARYPFSPDVQQALEAHPWPGNVRELRNVVERAVALAGSGPIRPEHLRLTGPPGRPVPTANVSRAPPASAVAAASLEDAERAAITRALEATGGQKSQAAQLLGIDRGTLRRRMRELGIERE